MEKKIKQNQLLQTMKLIQGNDSVRKIGILEQPTGPYQCMYVCINIIKHNTTVLICTLEYIFLFDLWFKSA